MPTDAQIETEIQEKGLTAPRITIDTIEAAIKHEQYLQIPDTNLTLCILHLKNGFLVTGKSVCVDAKNFDPYIGRKIARKDALDQCWPLFGFYLASVTSGWMMGL